MLMSPTRRAARMLTALSLAACTKNIINPGEGDQPAPAAISLLNVSYDPTRATTRQAHRGNRFSHHPQFVSRAATEGR